VSSNISKICFSPNLDIFHLEEPTPKFSKTPTHLPIIGSLFALSGSGKVQIFSLNPTPTSLQPSFALTSTTSAIPEKYISKPAFQIPPRFFQTPHPTLKPYIFINL
jgi:hypothetical protein